VMMKSIRLYMSGGLAGPSAGGGVAVCAGANETGRPSRVNVSHLRGNKATTRTCCRSACRHLHNEIGLVPRFKEPRPTGSAPLKEAVGSQKRGTGVRRAPEPHYLALRKLRKARADAGLANAHHFVDVQYFVADARPRAANANRPQHWLGPQRQQSRRSAQPDAPGSGRGRLIQHRFSRDSTCAG